jgi:5-methylcytosine-specific restriction endonuclease McrA
MSKTILLMDDKEVKYIMNVLRQGTIAWSGRKEALNASRKRFKEGKYKNGNTKWLYYYQCADCSEWFRDYEVEVDHVVEVDGFKGSWDEFVSRMYNADNLQVLCCTCHQIKTSSFMAMKDFKRKS